METKVVYYMEENAKSDIPYLIRLPTPVTGVVTLSDLKRSLSSSLSSTRNYKYYFQMHEDGVGNVRVEISDDNAQLPRQGETITCWLIVKDNSDNNNENIDTTSRGVMNRKTGSSKQLSSGNSNNNMQQYQQHQQQMIYDSMEIGRRGSFKPAGRTTPLKDLNCDDFNLTETDSLANAFDDLRMNRAGSMKSNMNINNNPSIKRPTKPQFSSFNNHIVKPPARQLSLDHKQGRIAQKHPLPPPPPSFKANVPFLDSFDDTASSDDDDDSSITTLMHGGHHYLVDTKTTVNDHDTIDDETTALTQTDFTQTNTQSILSSELEDPSTTFFDTENDFADDDDDQFSSITTDTVKKASRARKKAKHQIQNYMKHDSLHSSMTSLADSTMSLNIITVVLDMTVNTCLGITIVGQSNKGGGDGGIFVGSIQKNGAVALDGRIEPGDMILQVNDISLENLPNEEAVTVLREAAKKPDPLKLVVAKCWSADPKGYFTVSRNEPVRPIDPVAWVAHTQAHTTRKDSNYAGAGNYGNYGHGHHHHNRLTRSISSFGSSSSLDSSLPDSTLSLSNYSDNYTRGGNYQHAPRAHPYNPYRHHQQQQQNTITTNTMDLTTESDMETVVRSMAMPDSGLDVRDHEWLKVKLSNAFLGAEVVQWLFNHVEGFPELKDARKYASQLLKQGYIRHAVARANNKFSQKCLYQFGDLNGTLLGATTAVGPTLAPVNEESETEIDSVSEYNERNNYYMPHINNKMSGNKLPTSVAPGSYMTSNNSQQPYQHIKSSNYASSQNMFGPKIYSHMNSGLGGPPPPPSYVSSSSSNATSTSTASNNTTSQTIGTAISSSNKNGGMIVSSNPAACQFYFAPPMPPSSQPPPHANLHLTSYTNDESTMNSQLINNSTQLGASSMFLKTETTLSQTLGGSFSSQLTASQGSNNSTTIESAAGGPGNMTSNPPNSMVSHFDTTAASSQSGGSMNNSGFKYITSHFKLGGGASSNRSSKSSDASSSGHGSDMELLSSSKSRFSMKKKQQAAATSGNVFYQQQTTISSSKSSSNYYEINKLVQSKPLDKVSREHRVSKQSFLKAMDNPCNIIDAI